jgi:hypothetical protein
VPFFLWVLLLALRGSCAQLALCVSGLFHLVGPAGRYFVAFLPTRGFGRESCSGRAVAREALQGLEGLSLGNRSPGFEIRSDTTHLGELAYKRFVLAKSGATAKFCSPVKHEPGVSFGA